MPGKNYLKNFTINHNREMYFTLSHTSNNYGFNITYTYLQTHRYIHTHTVGYSLDRDEQ